ncbi:unnamed protein product [Cyprideis torosa]|uniref:Uncharacterized protein n=1 Tax=Cyprideis torosa TaxID=163714 RepID=A0A7R8WCR8_9CRUS|nr:unnamed protein product [Cyprideis torosa]CAG0887796.1 unnamed protein product [Cyprideis torosa]
MAERVHLKLTKFENGQPWGFRLTGGVEFGTPLSILKVASGSAAEKSGLQAGDILVSIQGKDASIMTHKEVQSLVMRSGTTFEVMVQRPSGGWRSEPISSAPASSIPPFGSQESNTAQSTSMSGISAAKTLGGAIAVPLDGNKKLVSNKYNTPIGLYSEDNIAETLTAQAEVLGGKCLGINFKKNEREFHRENSSVLKMVEDMDKGLLPDEPPVDATADGLTSSHVPTSFRPFPEHTMADTHKPVHQPTYQPMHQPEFRPVSAPTTFKPSTFTPSSVGAVTPVSQHHVNRGEETRYHPHGFEKSSFLEDKMSSMSVKGSHKTSVTEERRVESFQSSFQRQSSNPAPTSPVVWPPPKPDGLPSPKASFASSPTFDMTKHPLSVSTPPATAPPPQSAYKSPLISPSNTYKPGSAPSGSGANILNVAKIQYFRSFEAYGNPHDTEYVHGKSEQWKTSFRSEKLGNLLDPTTRQRDLHAARKQDPRLLLLPDHHPECLKAIGRHFHPECFLCTQCKKPFGNSVFFLEDGMPFCETDWNLLFTTKCIGCGFPIEAGDRWIEALNSSYHSQCFKCSLCHKSLEGQSFLAKGNKPYCKTHGR